MARTADFTITSVLSLQPFQDTILDICLNDPDATGKTRTTTGCLLPNFSSRYAKGWATELQTRIVGADPYLIVGPAQWTGLHLEGSRIPSDEWARSNIAAPTYMWVVDVAYAHSAKIMDANNAALEALKGPFQELFRRYRTLKDSSDVLVPGCMFMTADGFQTVILPEGRPYVAMRFRVHCWMEQSIKPVGAP